MESRSFMKIVLTMNTVAPPLRGRQEEARGRDIRKDKRYKILVWPDVLQ